MWSKSGTRTHMIGWNFFFEFLFRIYFSNLLFEFSYRIDLSNLLFEFTFFEFLFRISFSNFFFEFLFRISFSISNMIGENQYDWENLLFCEFLSFWIYTQLFFCAFQQLHLSLHLELVSLSIYIRIYI